MVSLPTGRLFVSVCGFAVMTSKPTLKDSVARSATAADRKPVILSASEGSAFSPFEQPNPILRQCSSE
jgi:hypothetical protein